MLAQTALVSSSSLCTTLVPRPVQGPTLSREGGIFHPHPEIWIFMGLVLERFNLSSAGLPQNVLLPFRCHWCHGPIHLDFREMVSSVAVVFGSGQSIFHYQSLFGCPLCLPCFGNCQKGRRATCSICSSILFAESDTNIRPSTHPMFVPKILTVITPVL